MRILMLIVGVVFLSFAGCKSKERLADFSKSAPDWVKERPISSAYYIGIGVASKVKSPTDYASIAKNNALSDLASEIEVKINANSVLYNLEQNSRYREDYLSTTRLKSELNLEEFEAVDSYSDKENYYIYYRLSKADYAAMVARKRNEAVAKASSYIREARISKEGQDYSRALNNYMQALLAAKDYLGDALEVSLDISSSYFCEILNKEVGNLLSDIEISLPEGVLLIDYLKQDGPIGFYVNNAEGKMLKNLPLKLKQSTGFSRGLITNTNNLGFLSFIPADLKITNAKGAIKVELVAEEMLSDNLKKESIVVGYLGNFKTFEEVVQYQIQYPEIYVEGNELNFGKAISGNYLQTGIKQSASNNGIAVMPQKNQAKVIVAINSDTQQGGVNFELYTAILNGNIKFSDATTGEIIYSHPLTKLKGVGLNYEVAGQNAYEKASSKVGDEVIEAFLKSLTN